MVVENSDEVTRHAAQAREFLDKAGQYLPDGDLHQASEKGWGGVSPRLGVREAQPVPPGDEPAPPPKQQ